MNYTENSFEKKGLKNNLKRILNTLSTIFNSSPDLPSSETEEKIMAFEESGLDINSAEAMKINKIFNETKVSFGYKNNDIESKTQKFNSINAQGPVQKRIEDKQKTSKDDDFYIDY